MSSKGVVVKVEYHTVGMFYTVRGKRVSDIRSLKKMQGKIMSVTNAKWKWHVVLTFDPKSLEYWFGKYGTVGKALAMYFGKLRSKFWGFKYFWKYEEGTRIWCKVCDKKVYFTRDKEREGWVFCNVCGVSIKGGELPHFHLLFDFANRTVRFEKDKEFEKLKRVRLLGKIVEKRDYVSGTGVDMVEVDFVVKRFSGLDVKRLIHPKSWDKMNWKRWFAKQYSYAMNKYKTKIELLLGYYMFKKWGNGIAYVREIISYMDLRDYVKKDFYKYTESKFLKMDAKKWYYSRNVDFDPEGEVQVEWEQVLETVGMFGVGEALLMVQSTKKTMIDYYNGVGKIGAYIYERVTDDIRARMVDDKGLLKKGDFFVDYFRQKRMGDKYG